MAKQEITIDGIVGKKNFSSRLVTLVVREAKIPTSVIDLELAVASNGQIYKVMLSDYRGQLSGLKDGQRVRVKGYLSDGKHDSIEPNAIEAWDAAGKYTPYKV